MGQGLPKNISQIVDERGEKINYDPEQDERFEIDVYNTENAHSVINMLPPRIKETAKQIDSELKDMNNAELRKLIKPDAMLNQLRLRFWYCFDEAVISGKKLSVNSICKGICQAQVFSKIVRDPEKLAYILNPVAGYEIQIEEFLETSLYKMRQGLENIEIKDAKDLNAVLKLYEVFDKRINGDYTKKEKKYVKIDNGNNKSSGKSGQFQTSHDVRKYLEDNNLEGEL